MKQWILENTLCFTEEVKTIKLASLHEGQK